MYKSLKLAVGLAAISTLISCEKNNEVVDQPLSVPSTYEFTREGNSSVSYSGQTDRLNQLGEMKSMLTQGDGGYIIDEADLLAMFENANGDGNGNFTFSSTKQLKNKTFDLDQTYFENILKEAAAKSVDANNGAIAADGTAGLIARLSNNKTILVDANGFEYTQMFEKGLMGGTFFYQIANVYLSDAKIGPTVDNTNVDPVKNYTDMEHHWDEAFGYFGAPVDFTSDYQGNESPRYWAKYSNTSDAALGLNESIMFGFRKGRAAIVAKKDSEKYDGKARVMNHFNKLVAATAIHYANEAKSTTDMGDLLHVLSECYAFTRALKYANPEYRKMDPTEVQTLLDNTLGTNLWTVTATELNLLIDTLSSTYELDDVKNIL